MVTIYVLSGFNNYYNRIVKKFDTVGEYAPYVHYTLEETNFAPNDNVDTRHVIGTYDYDGIGDYLLVVNDSNEIVSRWFIIESVRTRAGQYELTLHRDLVTDHYDELLDAPMFIEKATLTADDPLIFNSEDMTVNQIKASEFLLENNLKTPWVVAYLSRKDGQGNYNSFSGKFTYERIPKSPDYILDSLDDYEFNYFVNNTYFQTDNISFQSYYRAERGSTYNGYLELSYPGAFHDFVGNAAPDNAPIKPLNTKLVCENPTQTYNEIRAVFDSYNTVLNGVPYNSLANVGTAQGLSILAQETGKTIKVGDDYYEISAKIDIDDYDLNNEIGIPQGTDLYTAIFDKLVKPSGLLYDNNTYCRSLIRLPFRMNKVTLTIEKLEPTRNLSYNFSYTEGITTDAVYEIIATPYKTISFEVEDGVFINSDGGIGLQWFQSLHNDNSTKVIDVQLVPYIPIDDTNITNYKYVTVHTTGTPTEIAAIAIQLPISTFSKIIPYSLPLNDNTKIGNETELWRITSPNGIGRFDFSPYKNNGVDLFEVDCTLLPVNPYIKINPYFNANGLYGGDYDDYRGLICGGDFSVSVTSSEWQTYQQQNKNFNDIFQREIESMELKNNVQRANDIAGGIAGVGQGIAAGAMTGSIVPGIGTVVGAIGGGVASLVGGAADIAHNQILRNESIDYAKDQFGYQLGNIKARSTTLTKSTSYNKNNKYFPYIEYYTCTEVEKRAIANKIAYNGMTVMRIGTMNEFISNSWSYNDIESKGYIKGKLIRLETIEDDYHIVNAISGELNKGVYIQ